MTAFLPALLDPSEPVPVGLVGPQDRPAGCRFDVYRNNVVSSLSDAMELGFPVIHKLVGTAFFRAMAAAFLRAHPPQTPMLFAWGADFPSFLEGFAPVAQLPYLADVARLELALRESYHAADAAAVDPAALGRDDLVDCRLVLAPSTRLLASPYPIYTIWRANTDNTPAELHEDGEWVLVTRAGFDPLPTRLAPPAGRFVAALLAGATLGAAVDAGGDGLDLSETLTLLIGQNAVAALAPAQEPPQ